MEKSNLVEEAQAYFFEAMIEGYASGIAPTPHPSLRGWSQIIHQQGLFRLADEWCKIGGRTLIYDNKVPIWVMRYRGNYPDSVTPLLKQALFTSYNANRFNGCRGPRKFANLEHIYVNNHFGDFAEFSGQEQILDGSLSVDDLRRVIGEHTYWGGMLVGNNDSFRIA